MENCTIYMHRKERGKGRERDLQCGQNLSEIATILVFYHKSTISRVFFKRLSTYYKSFLERKNFVKSLLDVEKFKYN